MLDFDTPALVVGEMPVEAVHLVVCHHVEHPLYLAHRVEVARAVYHEASPAKLRRVVYLHASHRRSCVRRSRHQLAQSGYAVDHSGIVAALDGGSLGADAQPVGSAAETAVEPQPYVALLAASPYLATRLLRQGISQICRGVAESLVGGAYGERGGQSPRGAHGLHLYGLRDDGRLLCPGAAGEPQCGCRDPHSARDSGYSAAC